MRSVRPRRASPRWCPARAEALSGSIWGTLVGTSSIFFNQCGASFFCSVLFWSFATHTHTCVNFFKIKKQASSSCAARRNPRRPSNKPPRTRRAMASRMSLRTLSPLWLPRWRVVVMMMMITMMPRMRRVMGMWRRRRSGGTVRRLRWVVLVFVLVMGSLIDRYGRYVIGFPPPNHKTKFAQVLFRTKMQTHDFNTPFQLGTNCT